MGGQFTLYALAIIGAAVYFGLQIIRQHMKQSSPEDEAKTHENLKIARDKAAQGDGDSQLRLGLAYHSGIGIQRNFREAYFWLSLALKSGNNTGGANDPVTRGFLKEAGAMMVDAERDEIDRRIAGWHPGPHAADSVELKEAPVVVK